jgi:hypothetical protein
MTRDELAKQIDDCEPIRKQSLAVADTYRLVARRVVGRGQEEVTIDSPSINLG